MRRKIVYTGLFMLATLSSTAGAWSMGKTGDPAVVAVDGMRAYYPVYVLDKARVAPLLPSSYDYRKERRAPKVKDQGNYGACWAFASLTVPESALMPGEKMDLSEDHMSPQNGFNLTQDDGGEYTMSIAYLLGWQGPVCEKDDPYGDGVSPQGLKSAEHVQEIQVLPQKDHQKIKAAVYFRGGVQSSLYTSIKSYKSQSVHYNENTFSYCYIRDEKPNHGAVIVGWDDNFPGENFNMELPGDGALLCASSWGMAFGDGGYFYVSYYDSNIGMHNILYMDVESVDNYDRIYQTNLCGWVGQPGYGKENAYGVNVYQAGECENLEVAGLYATDVNTEYEVYVSRHVPETPDSVERGLAASGEFENAGFYTVKLDTPVELDAGERFGVMIKITTPGSVHPVATEYQTDSTLSLTDISDGEGYISFWGTSRESMKEKYGCNLRLKAYTSMRDGASQKGKSFYPGHGDGNGWGPAVRLLSG